MWVLGVEAPREGMGAPCPAQCSHHSSHQLESVCVLCNIHPIKQKTQALSRAQGDALGLILPEGCGSLSVLLVLDALGPE